MKFIWTLWTAPWDAPRPWDLLCYAVSVGFARRLSGDCTIYTDQEGAWLVEQYAIEAECKVIDFDIQLDSVAPKFAAAKLKTISLQQDAFCHLDHDVFLLKAQKTDPGKDIITQNLEIGPNWETVYKSAYALGKMQGMEWPVEIEVCAGRNEFGGYNCGYVQGNNPDVSKAWSLDALQLAKKFYPTDKSDNVIVEQMTLYAYSQARGYNIGSLFDIKELNQLGPEMAGYVHLMGDKVAAQSYVTARLMQRAKEVAPAFYEKCFPHLPLA